MKKSILSALLCASATLLATGAHAQAQKLLITEVVIDCINPEASADSSEYLEIHNPNAFAVTLDNYYISDTQLYWQMTTATDNKLAVGTSDHLIGFPTGTSIPANGIVVVTQNGGRFLTDHGFANVGQFTGQPGSPQVFEVADSAQTGAGLLGSNTRMRNLNTDASTDGQNNFSKTNSGASAGEFVVLFHWDGNPASNVVDVDMVSWGGATITTASNRFLPKNPATNATGYAADAGTYDTTLRTGNLSVIYRINGTELNQVATGGNGVGGRDESTELCDVTNPSSSWRGFASGTAPHVGTPVFGVPRYSNADLTAPNGVTPGEAPLTGLPSALGSSTSDWLIYN